MARRGAGEGSVWQRSSDGMWAGTVHLGWYDGKRQRKTVYAKTQAEVIRKLRVLQANISAGKLIPPERLKVGELLDQWLAEAVAGHVARTTHSDYESIVRVHLKPHLGHIRVRALTPQTVQQMINKLQTTGLSARRIQYIRVVLGAALRYAQRNDIITHNAASSVKLPPVKSREIVAMSPDEARAIMAALSTHREAALFTVAIATGLRQGELLGLRWSDVELEEPARLRVTGTLHRIEGGATPGTYVRDDPKTRESTRTIALPAIATDALRSRRLQQIEQRLAAGPHWRDTMGLVFTTPYGKPLHATTLTKALQAALAAAGLPRIRFHDLRHAAATLMLAQGVPLKVIQTTLGHSTIAVTSNVYAHVLPELQAEAAAKMDAVLRG